MIDRYLDGKVERISPEAPVPVLRLKREDNRLGGAANVALNLKALGATALLAGVVGDDTNGTVLRELSRQHGLDTRLIVTDPGRPTTVKTRLTSGGQQLMRVDRETTDRLGGSTSEALLLAIRLALGGGDIDAVLLQDYNKGVLFEDLTTEVLAMAKASGVPTIVDPKRDGFWDYRGATFFKPNLREIQQQVDFPVEPNLKHLDRAAAVIFEKIGPRYIMVTLSEHGVYIHDGKSSSIHPTDARDVADVSGAGDTVISVIACALAAGVPLPTIARLANLAGAQVIAKRGVVAIDLEQLRRAALALD